MATAHSSKGEKKTSLRQRLRHSTERSETSYHRLSLHHLRHSTWEVNIHPINARTEINNLQKRVKDGTQSVDMLGKDGVSIKGKVVGVSGKLLTSPRFKARFKFQDLAYQG